MSLLGLYALGSALYTIGNVVTDDPNQMVSISRLGEAVTEAGCVAVTVGTKGVAGVIDVSKVKRQSGYMRKSDLDTALNRSTVAIPANFAGLEAIDVPTRLEEQLFEIIDVDEEENEVTITAQHIWYSLLQNNTTWKATADANYTAAAVCKNVLNNAIFPVEFEVESDCTDTLPAKKLDYERKNIVEAFLDPEKGICKQYGLSLIRDNFRFYCLKEVGYDRGFVVEHGKNLLGIERQESIANLATRIAPIAKDSKGNVVWLNYNGLKYIDSQYIGNYRSPKLEIYDTGLQIGKEGVTEQNIQAKLLEAAQKRFSEDKVDIPEVTMTVEFISLGDTEEYAQYRGLDKVYLYDILTIKDAEKGYDYSAQVIGVEHDILTGQLLSVKIGSLKQSDGSRKIAVWQVPEVDGTNIRLFSIQSGAYAPDSINGDDIADHVITYAHFASATIDSLNADAIQAITAQIETIIAGHITAESIKTTEIDAINATLGTAVVKNGLIDNADIGFAKIKTATAESLIARDAVTDKYYIDKLAVRSAQMVQATVGELIIKATDDKYYRLDINAQGALSPTDVTSSLTNAEKTAGVTSDGHSAIIETDLTVADLSASNMKAINALIDKISASRIDVDELFARSAFIGKLNTTNIESTAHLKIKTGGSFTVDSGNFSIDASGNVTMSGTVTAGANSVIGGWTLGAKNLHSGSSTGYVEINSDTSATYAIWAGHETAASAPFSVTRAGAIKATSGTIGGFTIGATRLSAGSGTNSVGLDSGTASFDYAIWAGNATASSAPFRLKRDGTVTLTKLMVLGEDNTEAEVNLRTAGLWKLSYATVKSISVSGNTLTISTTAGTTTFSKAGTTAHLVGGWTGNTYEVYADNDPEVLPVSTTLTGSKGTGSTSGTWTINSFDSNHLAYGAVAATGVTGNLFGFNVDATSEYNAGVTEGTTAGYNSAKLSGSWNGKQWLVTKGTTGTNQVGITISATIAYDTTTHKYTAKANADGSLIDSVESGTQAYTAGTTAGYNSAKVQGSWSNNVWTVSKVSSGSTSDSVNTTVTAAATISYDSTTHKYTATAKASAGGAVRDTKTAVSGTEAFTAGNTAGYNSAKLSGSFSGAVWTVTKGTTGSDSVSLTLSATASISYDPTTHKYTATGKARASNADRASATAESGTEAYADGQKSVTASTGSWSNGSRTISLSSPNTNSYTVSVGNASNWSLSNTADKTALASVTVAGKTFTNAFTFDWINHGDYNAGWNAALSACGIPGGGNVRTGGTYYANLYVMGQSGPSRVGSGYVGVNSVYVDAK